ncbi:MAG TPA: type II secretion system protein, partial [Phycisphaerales bacterium]|nr:type II secretion system protein [Phycisphaerales bacterium]
ILRQDPDIIMVGEIRDAETAEIAVRSALTGHLIFSTLHTNDSVSAVGRLIDMGVEPFLLASVLEGILAQRLGRRVCPHCAAEVPLEEAVRHRLSAAEAGLFPGLRSRRGRGCEKCNSTGFRGRVGFFEMLRVTPALRAAVTERRTSVELLRLANGQFVSMRRDGLIKASRGITTVEEVLRATQDAGEGDA